MIIRATTPADIPALRTVLNETGLFPSEMLSDLLEPFLVEESTHQLWLSCVRDETVIGFCYAAEETLAAGTWNMLAIGVRPAIQGRGAGSRIVEALETHLRDRKARILIADTSGTDEFAGTRAFYRKAGYVEEARIRDFWMAGDDKIVFWKRLST